MAKLEGKVAIVTGASRGIGKAACLGLAREGANIVAAARTENEIPNLPGTIHKTAEEARALGVKALAVRVDVSDEESVEQMLRKTLDEFGRIDILVNNAAVAWYPPLWETPAKRWDLVVKVNLRGTFLCTRAVLPTMMEQKSGNILNVSSGAADIGQSSYTGLAYCTTKAAIERFTDALAQDVKEYNVAVNAIKPRGAVSTEGMRFNNPDADYSGWDKPEDFMVKAIVFLACQDAASITGQRFVDEELCRKYNL